MSWNFTVTENTPQDALREFGNSAFDNRAHIPIAVYNGLDYAARSMVETVKDARKVTLVSAGHFGEDGNGNCEMRMIVQALPVVIPNVPEGDPRLVAE